LIDFIFIRVCSGYSDIEKSLTIQAELTLPERLAEENFSAEA
jgi:hypothetical protein